jgi:hypothetical protein
LFVGLNKGQESRLSSIKRGEKVSGRTDYRDNKICQLESGWRRTIKYSLRFNLVISTGS